MTDDSENEPEIWDLEDTSFDEDDFVIFCPKPDSLTAQLQNEAKEIRQLWELEEPAPAPEGWEPEPTKFHQIASPDHDRTMEIRREAARLIGEACVVGIPAPLDPEAINFAERALLR